MATDAFLEQEFNAQGAADRLHQVIVPLDLVNERHAVHFILNLPTQLANRRR